MGKLLLYNTKPQIPFHSLNALTSCLATLYKLTTLLLYTDSTVVIITTLLAGLTL